MPPVEPLLHSRWLTVQRYNKKQLFAIVCSDFVLKSAHIFDICTDYQVVIKPLNISHLKRESVSFLSKSFLSFSKTKTLFLLYKEYIYKYIFIYIFFIELFSFSKSKMTKMTLTKMTRLGLLVKYNNISCWCVWMEILVVKFCEYHFFCSWNGRERVRENGWKSIF